MKQVIEQVIVFALLAASSALAVAADAPSLESGLLHAMQLKPGTTERTGTSGRAIRAYQHAGLVSKTPRQRFDYTDYYLLEKPVPFMGHELVLIEEEYRTRYIGCCASPGVGITLKVHGSLKNLQQFARANRCTLTDHVDFAQALREVAIKNKVPRAHYASLSCRERDAERDES